MNHNQNINNMESNEMDTSSTPMEQYNTESCTNTEQSSINTVPGFILKLWRMVNDPECDDLICWSDNGKSFIINDPPRFSQELSKYFKHNNLSSFIRQLNMYGFRKVATIENHGADDLHFYHHEFLRDCMERLENIKRKLPQKLAETIDLKNVYKGITEIEVRQKDVTNTLTELKRENQMLWQELHDLRLKHQQQQAYIGRLMKLVYEAMEQNGIKAGMFQLGHNPPLMIEGTTEPSTEEVVNTTPSNEHLTSQVETAELQIDNLVPTIGEFIDQDDLINDDQLNLFN